MKIISFLAISIINSLICLTWGTKPKIIIVGAGSAGIAAASRLVENNFTDVKILEAESRFGGRINTVDYGKGKIDLGAEWCEGQMGNIVYQYVKDLDLLVSTKVSEKFHYSSRKNVDMNFSKDLQDIFDQIMNEMEREAPKTETMGEYFSKR